MNLFKQHRTKVFGNSLLIIPKVRVLIHVITELDQFNEFDFTSPMFALSGCI